MAQDVVMADAYFTVGIKGMEDKNFDLACPNLEKSQKMDPKPGTLFALADCERQWDRFVISLNYFDEYLRQVEAMSLDKRKNHAVRANLAKAHKAMMVKEVAQLVIVLPADVPSDAKVYRDGIELPNETLDKVQYVEAGNHLIRLEVEGMAAIEQTIFFEKGKVRRLEFDLAAVAPIHSVEEQPAPLEPVKEAKQAPTAVVLPPKADKSPSNRMRTGGFVALGIGAAGFATWGVTGALALSHRETMQANCPNLFCDSNGRAAVDSGRMLSHLATAGLGVGVLGATVGMVLFFSSKRGIKEEPAKPLAKSIVLDLRADRVVFGVTGAF